MGAGASLGALSSGILLDAQLNTGNGLQVNQPSLSISKEVLSNLKRKSFTELRLANRRRSKVKNLLPIHEIPPHVLKLLGRIGIHDDDSNYSSQQPAQNKTTKLVSHIFECLGALQHLVRSDQGQYMNHLPDEEDEQNSAMLGKLIHEMVVIYGLCGETIRIILDSNPEAACVEDGFGRLPVHVALDAKKPWIGPIASMVDACPESLCLKVGAGRLPLHVAVDQENPNLEVVKLLVDKYSTACSITRGVGRLPIHYAVFPESISLEVVDCLLHIHSAGKSVRPSRPDCILLYSCLHTGY